MLLVELRAQLGKASCSWGGHRASRTSIPLRLRPVPTAAPLLCFSGTSLNLPFAQLSISPPLLPDALGVVVTTFQLFLNCSRGPCVASVSDHGG